jgi:hypothetical protein
MNLLRRHVARFLTVSACLLGGAPAVAGTLEATIMESSGKPLRDVRVELIGPTQRTLFTGEQGTVRLELPGGNYTLRLINQGRQVELDLQVPREGTISPSFELVF